MPPESGHSYDVIIIGAGASGLMCALTAGYRGRRVLVLDHASKAGRKILMSGGGRCNFTNLNTTPANYLSTNPAFCISALKRYTPEHFVELVERHGIEYYEHTPGQLFCVESSREILNMLLTECEWAGVEIRLKTSVETVERKATHWELKTSRGPLECGSLVIATGGLSIPTMGATGFGYRIAEQFGLPVVPVRAALVPFTLQPAEKAWLEPLSGISCEVRASVNGVSFTGPLLITHRGLSGPPILQVSGYWNPGDNLTLDFLPGIKDPAAELIQARKARPAIQLSTWLGMQLPKRLAQALCEQQGWDRPLQEISNAEFEKIAAQLKGWQIKPAGTEGYRTAEVTLGGVDTRAFSSRTFMANEVEGLFMIGEVLDVTGQLGGYNFQWAWASGVCAGQEV